MFDKTPIFLHDADLDDGWNECSIAEKADRVDCTTSREPVRVLEYTEYLHIELTVSSLVFSVIQRYASQNGLSKNKDLVCSGLDFLDLETNLRVLP